MERNVNICDDCNEKVAKTKCELCKRDLCNYCRLVIALNLNTNIGNETPLSVFTTCKQCYSNLRKELSNLLIPTKDGEFQNSAIITPLFDYFNSLITLAELKKNGNNVKTLNSQATAIPATLNPVTLKAISIATNLTNPYTKGYTYNYQSKNKTKTP